jgi:hypothetical protein
MREVVANCEPGLNDWLQQKETQGRRRRVLPERAPGEVVVDHPDRLHRRVERRRPDEDEAASLELFGQRLRFGSGRLEIGGRLRRRPLLVWGEGPDQPIERVTAGVQLARGLCVGDRRLDLARLRTMPASSSRRSMSASPYPATFSISNPSKARRKFSRFRRIVSQESPDWNASRTSRSNSSFSLWSGRPHSLSW